MDRARNYPKRANPAAVPEIARRLRMLRMAVAESITDLSIQTGITRSAWSNYENGSSRIGVDAAMKLCDRYHVSLDWIYRGLDAMIPHGLAKRLQEVAKAEEADA
jgi:transcriptional regulator with XRE-family HTH domain